MNGKQAKQLRRTGFALAADPNAKSGFRVQKRLGVDGKEKAPAVLRALNPKSARFQTKQLKRGRTTLPFQNGAAQPATPGVRQPVRNDAIAAASRAAIRAAMGPIVKPA